MAQVSMASDGPSATDSGRTFCVPTNLWTHYGDNYCPRKLENEHRLTRL